MGREKTALALDAGAADLVDEGDTWRLTCEPTGLMPLVDFCQIFSVSARSIVRCRASWSLQQHLCCMSTTVS